MIESEKFFRFETHGRKFHVLGFSNTTKGKFQSNVYLTATLSI